MFDPEDVPLTTSEGRRPSSTAGDRMMVGLAVAALLGGVLIAVGRLLPEQPVSSQMNTSLRMKLRLGKQVKHRFIKIPSATGENVCNSLAYFCSSTVCRTIPIKPQLFTSPSLCSLRA